MSKNISTEEIMNKYIGGASENLESAKVWKGFKEKRKRLYLRVFHDIISV